jgi:hypothetical protein
VFALDELKVGDVLVFSQREREQETLRSSEIPQSCVTVILKIVSAERISFHMVKQKCMLQMLSSVGESGSIIYLPDLSNRTLSPRNEFYANFVYYLPEYFTLSPELRSQIKQYVHLQPAAEGSRIFVATKR